MAACCPGKLPIRSESMSCLKIVSSLVVIDVITKRTIGHHIAEEAESKQSQQDRSGRLRMCTLIVDLDQRQTGGAIEDRGEVCDSIEQGDSEGKSSQHPDHEGIQNDARNVPGWVRNLLAEMCTAITPQERIDRI